MCIATMKSMTAAQKSKNVLKVSGIPCEIVNIDPMITKHGCAYGLEFPCAYTRDIKRFFSQKKVAYGEIIGEYRDNLS